MEESSENRQDQSAEEVQASEMPKRPLSESEYQLYKAALKKKQLYEQLNWYAVFVHSGHEYQVYDYLMGIDSGKAKKRRRGKAKKEDLFEHVDKAKVQMECYLPVLRVQVRYSDRVVWKEKIQTPGLLFVHTRLDDRDPLFHSIISEHVVGFVSDRALHQPLPIPEAQMILFMNTSDNKYAVTVAAPTYEVGQRVVFLESAMAGQVGELVAKREIISNKEFETDHQGKPILDAEGNPVPKHKIVLSIRLNSLLEATFEVDADKVTLASDQSSDYQFVE